MFVHLKPLKVGWQLLCSLVLAAFEADCAFHHQPTIEEGHQSLRDLNIILVVVRLVQYSIHKCIRSDFDHY